MKHRLINANCIKWLLDHPRQSKADCIFCDPPDGIGLGYNEFDDRTSEADYRSFLHSCLMVFTSRAPIVWFSFNARWTIPFGSLVDEFIRQNQEWEAKPCVQVFTFGQYNKHDLANNHRPLWRLKRKDAPLYPDQIKEPSWRQRNGDKRAAAGGRVPGDVIHARRDNLRPLPVMDLDDIKRLFGFIDQRGPDDCWQWNGGKDESGRGRFKISGDTYYAPRLVWRLTYGSDPLSMLVCHSCDNPSCCNPSHMFLGTDADNHKDRDSKDRGPQGGRNGRAKLSEHDVLLVYMTPNEVSNEHLANKYGVSRTAIRLIREGKTWQHVTQNVNPGSVFDFPRVTGNSKQRCDWHPTQLHEELVKRAVLLSTKEGDHVLDPFGGTGTTLRVCKQIGRRCTLVEMDATYCKKIREHHPDVSFQ